MDFYEVIEKRRTICDFDNEIIPDEVLERIIGAALKASIKQKDIDLKQRIHWDKW